MAECVEIGLHLLGESKTPLRLWKGDVLPAVEAGINGPRSGSDHRQG